MTTSTEFEDILTALRRKNEEDVKKAESKFAAVSVALAAAHKRRESLEDTDAQYREYYGLPRKGAPAIDPDLRAKFARLSTKEALQLIGRENDGMIVAKEVVKTLVRAAVYQSEKTASGNVYNTLARHTDVFEKVDRGLYHLIDAESFPPGGQHQPDRVPVDATAGRPVRSISFERPDDVQEST